MSRLRTVLLVMLLAVAANLPAGADDRVRVALLPLVVHSGEGRDYLQQGMTDMLVSRLGRERRIAVIPIEDAATATTDVAAARKTGQANEATYVVYGSLTRFGEGASVDLSVASVGDAAREPRTIYVHADTMGALISQLDGASDRVGGVVLGDAGEAVTAGPEAATAASASEVQDLRRRVELLERAVFTNSAPSHAAGAAGGDANRSAPGLPSDREGERLR